jgi:hypothetical protein
MRSRRRPENKPAPTRRLNSPERPRKPCITSRCLVEGIAAVGRPKWTEDTKSMLQHKAVELRNASRARTLNRLPFLGPVFAAGWPLDDPVGPRNQLKKSPKAG